MFHPSVGEERGHSAGLNIAQISAPNQEVVC